MTVRELIKELQALPERLVDMPVTYEDGPMLRERARSVQSIDVSFRHKISHKTVSGSAMESEQAEQVVVLRPW